MKRVAAIVVALMLIVGVASTGCAADKISDVYLESMKNLYETYQKTPEAFGDEAIVIAYCNYQMYENALLMEIMQTSLQFSVSVLGDQLKPTAEMFTRLTDIMSGEFKNWTAGETSNEQFLTYIMSFYKVTIDGKKE